MSSRILIILHPNTTRVDLVLNDRMFNTERYSFSRAAPTGAELQLLEVLNNCTVGIVDAAAAKTCLQLTVADGQLPCEYIPAVLTAVRHWAGADYQPSIYCDDRRWVQEPQYSSDPWAATEVPGVRQPAGAVYLGVDYQVWSDSAANLVNLSPAAVL